MKTNIKKINLIKKLLIGAPLLGGTIMTTACGQNYNPGNLSTGESKKAQIVKDAGANPNVYDITGAMQKDINSAVSLYAEPDEGIVVTVNSGYIKNLGFFVGLIQYGFSGQITIQFNS